MATEQQQARMCLILEAQGITYDAERGREKIVLPFFDELMGALGHAGSHEGPFPIGWDHLNSANRVFSYHLFEGFNHILLDIQPGSGRLILDIIWAEPTLGPAFVIGLVEDLFKPEQVHTQSFPLHANLRVEREETPELVRN